MDARPSSNVEARVETLTSAARAAARALAAAAAGARDTALGEAAARLRRTEASLLEANRGDVERARAAGESAAFVDRLTLTPARVEAMARGLEEIAALPDPVGETIAAWRRPNGLEIAQGRVPVIKHFEGICHLYVDASADLAMAERICLNAKVQRPSVCNAIENLLVHERVAPRFLPGLVAALRAHGCEVRGDPATRAIVPDVVPASDADWDTEYLDLVLSVAVVPSLDAALAFIARHSTGLAEAIVTEDLTAARRFLGEVDSAAVFVNASTRFTDGYEFGFGAEVGISTNRLHARGPMGLRELTTYKYQVIGSGQVRS